MNYAMPHISRRMIGSVNIFDISGDVKKDVSHGVASYLQSYIEECRLKNVLLNVQNVTAVDDENAHKIMDVLQLPRKRALFVSADDVVKTLLDNAENKPQVCKTQNEVINYFGQEMVEKEKIIEFEERRSSARMKTALVAQLDFVNKNENTIGSEAIVTNLSETGLFAEYLDLSSSIEVESLDYFKNLTVSIRIKKHDLRGTVIERQGKILRIEFSGTQTGIAIQFV